MSTNFQSVFSSLNGVERKIPAQLHFVPVDFMPRSLSTEIICSSFDQKTARIFNWLGVTLYLPREAVLATLRSIAGVSPSGSMVVFDYLDPDNLLPQCAAMMNSAG